MYTAKNTWGLSIEWKIFLTMILQQKINYKTYFPTILTSIYLHFFFDFFIEEWCKFQKV